MQDNLDRITDRNAPMYLTLYTFRESIKRFFGIDALPMIQSQDVKREVRKGIDDPNANMMRYPFAYFSVTGLSLIRDQQPTKSIARNSMGVTFDDLTNLALKKAFLFPATLQITLHYLTNDMVRALDFSSRALIVATTGKINSEVELDGVKWFVTTRVDSESVSLEPTDKESEQNPDAMDVQITFSVDTKLGAIRDVPKVNNAGIVTQSINVGKPDEQ